MKKHIIIPIAIVVALILSFTLGILFIKTFDKSNTNSNQSQIQYPIKNDLQENTTTDEISSQDINKDQEIYYLHKSNLENPSKEQCDIAKSIFFHNIDENERKEIQTEMLYIHSNLEHLLVDSVSITGDIPSLKDSNSPYWINFTEKGVHEEPGHPEIKVESNGGFSNILEKVQNIISKLENVQIKNDLQKSCKLLQEGIDNHDISKLFDAHKIIHDYDYWVVNNSISLPFQPVDWGGINVYFGKVSIM